MAKITPEDKARLKQSIKTLKMKSLLLERDYKRIMRKLWMQFVYLLLWLVVIIINQYYVEGISGAISIFAGSCIMLLILSVEHRVVLLPMIKQYRKTYREAWGTFDELIRLVDWEAYRKRQLYQDTDERVEDVIDGFLIFARKSVSPTKSTVFNALLLFQIILRYALYLWAVVIFFRAIVDIM